MAKWTLTVRPRGKPTKKLPEEVTVDAAATTSDLYEQLSAESGLGSNRLRVTKGIDGSLVANSTSTSLQSTGLRNGSQVVVKDLGFQIAWRTLFVVEYIGPLLIHPLMFAIMPTISVVKSYQARSVLHIDYHRNHLGPSSSPFLDFVPFSSPFFQHASRLQTLTFFMVMLQFTKREIETLFVHRFSNAFVAIFYVIKNSGHYWGLAGLVLALSVYRADSPAATMGPGSLPPGDGYTVQIQLGLAMWVLGNVANFITHLKLMNLRSPGTKERGIPTGMGFGIVTCPNYTYDLISWLGILVICCDPSVLVFLAVAVTQMILWAWKKERRYRQEFGKGYAKKRFVIIPGVV